MTLGQVKLYSQSLVRQEVRIGLNTMNWTRTAFHAEQDDYAEIVRDLQRIQ